MLGAAIIGSIIEGESDEEAVKFCCALRCRPLALGRPAKTALLYYGMLRAAVAAAFKRVAQDGGGGRGVSFCGGGGGQGRETVRATRRPLLGYPPILEPGIITTTVKFARIVSQSCAAALPHSNGIAARRQHHVLALSSPATWQPIAQSVVRALCARARQARPCLRIERASRLRCRGVRAVCVHFNAC
jgi:hypothetical protein